ncbi:hypothetical protein [Humidisolicoccus flavus]|uniref:hypothetical protein n=1 Tax=Humidisolicoccus flavus TaxID=3111414 RepID=UPI00324BE8AA
MNRINGVLALHTANRKDLLLYPAISIAGAFLVVIAIGVALNVGFADDPEVINGMSLGMQWNGAIFALLGIAFGVGVTMMTQYFPLSMGLGFTRREYMLGSLLFVAIQSAVIAVFITIMKVIEVATNGFGLNVSMFNVVYVSRGEWWETLVQSFLLLFLGTVAWAFFGTVWNRWGRNGLLTMAVIGILLSGIIVIVAFANPEMLASIASMAWIGWIAVTVVVTIITTVAWWVLARRAQVR